MHSPVHIFKVLALVAGISNVFALDGEIHRHKRSLGDILKKRIYTPPPGGWNDPNNYANVNWETVDYTGGNSGNGGADHEGSKPSSVSVPASPPEPSSQSGDSKTTVSSSTSSSAAPSSTSSQSGGDGHSGNGGGGHGGSGASCPSGCHMTISFSDDTLDVPFTAGNGGSPSTGSTKGTCICMSGGSVRVNIGSTNTNDHTTLIEGNAAGLSQASFYDVSYVEGYSYPVVCWSADNDAMSGSNIDLYTRGSCPGGGSKMGDICVNPGYPKLVEGGDVCWQCTLPDPFFGPASGAAYTYPRDDSPCASDGSKSASPMATGGRLTCCVGPQCRSNDMSKGGQTSGGRCDDGCTPCAGHGQCSSCKSGSKRDLERVFDRAPPPRKHKRHAHRHAAFHAAKGVN
ncbi:MAG: hypothetical protein Q9217_005723 [Psora testacea]